MLNILKPLGGFYLQLFVKLKSVRQTSQPPTPQHILSSVKISLGKN